jgi:hypothetical protein
MVLELKCMAIFHCSTLIELVKNGKMGKFDRQQITTTGQTFQQKNQLKIILI